MFLLYEEPKLFNLINEYGLSELLAESFNQIGNKGILRIDDSVILNSNKNPNQMPVPNDENQIRRIFETLRKNYSLYEQLYKGKIWLINSNDVDEKIIAQEKIKISPYTFFHLMGFDKRNINLSTIGGQEFVRIFPDSSQAFEKLSDFGKHACSNVFYIIEELLKSEENFLNACLSGQLSNAVNIEKIEMKCFSFERMGYIQNASGMIFFDKNKAIALGYENEVQHINSDVVLLNDFLRKYRIENLFGLDFVISPYSRKKENGISDQQSIFLTKQNGGGFNSHLFDQQKTSISSSVAGYKENDFNYSISEIGEQGGEIVYPDIDPIMDVEFSEDDRKKVAQTIIEAFPNVDHTYLNSLVDEKGKKR